MNQTAGWMKFGGESIEGITGWLAKIRRCKKVSWTQTNSAATWFEDKENFM